MNVPRFICLLSLVFLAPEGFQSLFRFPPNGSLSLSRITLNPTFGSKMASSQVEIVSSSPFGCVLRDHNRRDKWSRESNARAAAAQAAFQKNLKDLVRDHFNSCISASSQKSDPPSDDNTSAVQKQRTPKDDHENNNHHHHRHNMKDKTKIDHWARAREMMSPSFRRENSPARLEIPNIVGVSSLVQKWRDLARQNQSGSTTPTSPPVHLLRTHSGSSSTDNACIVDVPPIRCPVATVTVDEKFGTPSMMSSEESFADLESDGATPNGPPSARSRDDDAGERERLRVADIIRKLSSSTAKSQGSNDDVDPEQHVPTDQAEQQRVFPSIKGSPRLRGRQAFSDLLMQIERDRHRELEALFDRQAVSKFSHKGRLQAMLRLRLLREATVGVKDHRHSNSGTSDCSRPMQGSTITLLREKFNTGVENDMAKTPRGEVVNNTLFIDNSSTSNQLLLQDIHPQEVDATETSTSNQLLLQDIHPQEVNATETSASNQLLVQDIHPREISTADISTTKQLLIHDIHAQEVNSTDKQSTSQLCNVVSDRTEDSLGEGSPGSGTTLCSHEVSNLQLQESAVTVPSFSGWEENANPEVRKASNQKPLESNSGSVREAYQQQSDWEEQEANNQLQVGCNHDWTGGDSCPQCSWEERESNNQQLVGTGHDRTGGETWPQDAWDDQEATDQQVLETNCDWISDISRPRSDWEGLRRARYIEMLDPYSNNEDILKLLERKSVSTFLSSNLRETMDQLMISRVQRQSNPVAALGGQQEEQDEGLRERMDHLTMPCMQIQMHPISIQRADSQNEQLQEEEEDNDDDDDDNGDSPFGNQYDDDYHYFDEATSSMQMPSPSPTRSWSHSRDHEVSDDSDQTASPYLRQPPSSQSSYHPSIEMELIYDLRGHMEQLRHEVSQLQSSINSCMSMQVKLRRFIKQEVAAAVSQAAGQMRWTKSPNKGGTLAARKGSCCVCYKLPVNSLLYRCGHMCTCLKCAHELQWSSGKCPICQAPIVDVVRAYTDS